jgi:hypothetical protein
MIYDLWLVISLCQCRHIVYDYDSDYGSMMIYCLCHFVFYVTCATLIGLQS